MNTKYILFLVFTCFFLSTQAQVKEFGEITPEDFQAKYPNQVAEILFDQGHSYYTYPNNQIKLVYERHLRVLINSEGGFYWGNVAIPFYVESLNRETVYEVKAATYQLSEHNSIHTFPLDKSNIYEEKITEKQRSQNFALPQLAPGCIIEYTYYLESDYLANIPDWIFQDKVPVHWSECQVTIPPMFEFFVKSLNVDTFHQKEEKQDRFTNNYHGMEFHSMNYKWVLTDVPAIKKEPLISTLSDYYPRLDFQISKFSSPTGNIVNFAQDWPSFSKELLSNDYLGRHLRASKAVKALAKEMDGQLKGQSKREQVRIIRNYVAHQFQSSGKRRFIPDKSQKELLQTHRGNVADLNLLLYSLLSYYDFDVHPVILSTVDHGRVNTDFPFKRDYNYLLVLCQLGKEKLFLDATEPKLPFHLLPPHCLTDRGLILDKKDSKWIVIPPTPSSREVVTYNFLLNEENQIEGRAIWTVSNHSAYFLRREIASEGRPAFEEKIRANFTDDELQVEAIDIEHIDSPDQDVRINVLFSKDAITQEELLYLPPFPKTPPQLLNSFAEKDRQYPIHWNYLKNDIFTTRIIIKGDYELIDYPKSISIIFPDKSVRFALASLYEDNILSIRYKLHLKSLDFHKTAYPAFKQIFDLIAEKQSEYIVLKKKT